MSSQLFTKITRAAISELADNIKIPKGAKTYSYVSGTGQRGDFKILTFFNDAGKIIKRNSNYLDGNNTTQFVTRYDNFASKTAKIVNGKVENITKRDCRWKSNGRYLFTEATTFRDSLEDSQKLIYKTKGQLPQSMEVKTSWDGSAPQITYTNTDNIFSSTDAIEYLPGILDSTAIRRFEHVYKYQTRQQDIDDVFDSFKLVTSNDVSKISAEVAELNDSIGVSGVFEETTGDIFYVVGREQSFADEVDVIAHEVQHAKDFSDIARLRDTIRCDYNKVYYDKSRAKGLIMKSKHKKDYKSLSDLRSSLTDQTTYNQQCLKGRHDDLPIEESANIKGFVESERCSDVWRKLMVHFGFWGP